MIEFLGELHDEVLGLDGEGPVVIVEDGDDWEGSIDLSFVPGQFEYLLKQNGKLRGSIKIDFVGKDDEGIHAHFVGLGPLKRVI